MGYLCDHCRTTLHRDKNAYFVDESNSTDCPENTGGHTWEGMTR